jgi:hypothetical protein
MPSMSCRWVRAGFTDRTITVYQAYSPQMAGAAVAAGTFAALFKRERMTWIKPSFLWMMHRSGWATKPGQERILAIQITRDGFEWALGHAALSHHEPGTHASQQQWAEHKRTSPVRVQWTPTGRSPSPRSPTAPYKSGSQERPLGPPREPAGGPASQSAPSSSPAACAGSASAAARPARPHCSSSPPTCPPPSWPACSASTSPSPSPGSAPAAATGPATPLRSAAERNGDQHERAQRSGEP